MGFFQNLFGKKEQVDFKALLLEGAVVVDVRTVREFNTGHIEGSINAPVANIQQQIPKLKKKNKVIIAVCASGIRSANAANQMKQAGIEAYNGGSWMNINNLF